METFRAACLRIGLGIFCSLVAHAAHGIVIGEYSVAPITNSTSPAGVVAGPDGNVWFTAVVPNRIGRITPAGSVSSFSIPGFGMLTGGIAVGPDGNVWFTKEFNGAIMRMTPEGAVTEFPVSMDSPRDVAVGPDGNLWYAGSYMAGRITPAGTLTEFSLPEIQIAAITPGPDGNLWFAGRRYPAAQALIGNITSNGAVTAYPLGGDGLPASITAGPDGRLWFTFDAGIGRIATDGSFALFPYPVAGVPTSITTGPDGNLWFTDYGESRVGRITPEGTYLAFINTPTAASHPQRIATSPDGLIWFYESSNTIGVISFADTAGYQPLTPGATWSYSMNGGASSFTFSAVAGTTNINGANATLLSDSRGGGIYMTNDENGIREHREFDSSGDVTFSPPIVSANMAAVMGTALISGGTASGTFSGETFALPYSHSALIQAIETVTVPAGTFRAARIQLALMLSEMTAVETDWFASGVGAVKGMADTDSYELTATNLVVTTPDAFGYAVPSAAPPVTRNSFTVTGITAAAPISIAGGEYSVNGGLFTTAAGSVSNGQSVTVRPTAHVNPFVKQAVVTIGGVSGVFNTLVPAATPSGALLSFATGWNLVGTGAGSTVSVASTFGDESKVTSVWKWVASGAKWAFYTPSLAGQALTDYATGKGYDVLTTINPGEGFWVNAKEALTLQLTAGTTVTSESYQTGLATGWNLIAVGDDPTPSAFNKAIGAAPLPAEDIPINLTTLWAWDAALTNWYFYAPSLENSGGLTSYIAGKGYLDFATNGKTLGPGVGFWVNKP